MIDSESTGIPVSPSTLNYEEGLQETSLDESSEATFDEAYDNETSKSDDESSYSLPSESSSDNLPFDSSEGTTTSSNIDSEKIYDNCEFSVCRFNCLIMKFAIKHNLTFNAIDDLLNLFSLLSPKPNLIPTSIYKLKRFFMQHAEEGSTNQLFCSNCEQIKDCDCAKEKSGHLVSTPIEKPLQAILSGENNFVA